MGTIAKTRAALDNGNELLDEIRDQTLPEITEVAQIVAVCMVTMTCLVALTCLVIVVKR